MKNIEFVENKITYKAEIEFRGNIQEFEKLANQLGTLDITIRGKGWHIDHTTMGCWPIAIERILPIRLIRKFTIDRPKIILDIPIPGGIQPAHLHIDNEVVFLDHDQFKSFAGEVAQELAQRLAGKEDYVTTVGAIRNLVPGAK